MIALLRGETGGEIVRALLLNTVNECFAHSINLFEVHYDSCRRGGRKSADDIIAALASAGIQFRPDLDTHSGRNRVN